MCCSALSCPLKYAFSFAQRKIPYNFSPIKTMRKDRYFLCVLTICDLKVHFPWPAGPSHTPPLFLRHCFPPTPSANATLLHIVPKPCSELGSLFSLMKHPVISIFSASSKAVFLTTSVPLSLALFFSRSLLVVSAGCLCLWHWPPIQSTNQALIAF